MSAIMQPDDLVRIAPEGHYVALRIGFAFPLEQVNTLPADWVKHYTKQRFVLHDPMMQWAFCNVGAIRWSENTLDDPRRVLATAQTFGLRYGVTISYIDRDPGGQRSFGTFVRKDREFRCCEIEKLQAYLTQRHRETAPPKNLTRAELEALGMVTNGKRLKEIAHDLGVSEGAIKQRLKNAKLKLRAKTGTQAAAMASRFGLI